MTVSDATPETFDHLGIHLDWGCPRCRARRRPLVADGQVHSYCEACPWECCEETALIEINGHRP